MIIIFSLRSSTFQFLVLLDKKLSNAPEIMPNREAASKRNLSESVSNICLSQKCQSPLGWYPIDNIDYVHLMTEALNMFYDCDTSSFSKWIKNKGLQRGPTGYSGM